MDDDMLGRLTIVLSCERETRPLAIVAIARSLRQDSSIYERAGTVFRRSAGDAVVPVLLECTHNAEGVNSCVSFTAIARVACAQLKESPQWRVR